MVGIACESEMSTRAPAVSSATHESDAIVSTLRATLVLCSAHIVDLDAGLTISHC